MQGLIAIAVFVMLAGGVIFGVSRYRNPAKLEQPTELQDPTALLPPAIAALVSDQATVRPTTESKPSVEFKPSVIEDPWEIDSAPTIAALMIQDSDLSENRSGESCQPKTGTEEVVPD